MTRQLIAGNWKMNGTIDSARALAGGLAAKVGDGEGVACDWAICPPFPLLPFVADAIAKSALELGAQDCHPERAGAHTGDTSAELLGEIGCRYVIVGHSERRGNHGEIDSLVKGKAEAALAAGLVPIVCVGETKAEREAGKALAVIEEQVRGSLPTEGALVVAYEPVWAIGTGLTATPEDVAEAHATIHGVIGELLGEGRASATNILYGGSVKPGNAAALLAVAHVGGVLVGGASLDVEDFWAIGQAAAS